jgi:hypothetical protein
MEARTLLLVLMTLIVIGIAGLVSYQLLSGTGITTTSTGIRPQKQSVQLIGPLHSGQDSLSLTANLPLSMNENNGIEFSYAAWILINDYTYGTSKVVDIFNKGAATSVQLKVDTNTLIVNQPTYQDAQTSIQIRNLPAEKLFHLAVCVTQTTLDVYINGLLHTHRSLDSLPIQNQDPIQVGPNGGWKGRIGSFWYYNYALSGGEVRQLAAQKAVRDPNDEPPNPPYFDTSWWIGRRG